MRPASLFLVCLAACTIAVQASVKHALTPSAQTPHLKDVIAHPEKSPHSSSPVTGAKPTEALSSDVLNAQTKAVLFVYLSSVVLAHTPTEQRSKVMTGIKEGLKTQAEHLHPSSCPLKDTPLPSKAKKIRKLMLKHIKQAATSLNVLSAVQSHLQDAEKTVEANVISATACKTKGPVLFTLLGSLASRVTGHARKLLSAMGNDEAQNLIDLDLLLSALPYEFDYNAFTVVSEVVEAGQHFAELYALQDAIANGGDIIGAYKVVKKIHESLSGKEEVVVEKSDGKEKVEKKAAKCVASDLGEAIVNSKKGNTNGWKSKKACFDVIDMMTTAAWFDRTPVYNQFVTTDSGDESKGFRVDLQSTNSETGQRVLALQDNGRKTLSAVWASVKVDADCGPDVPGIDAVIIQAMKSSWETKTKWRVHKA